MTYWERENKYQHYFLFQIIFNELMHQMSQYNCQIISDTLPHLLAKSIGEKKELLTSIVQNQSVHKLTYFNEQMFKDGSILQEILKGSNNFDVAYKKNRKDITFCTILFNMGDEILKEVRNNSKNPRKFEDFYLKSLKRLAQEYEQLVLYCDQETADFLEREKLTSVKTKVMRLEDLKGFCDRQQCEEYLHEMKKLSCGKGMLFGEGRNPENLFAWMIITHNKLEVVKYAYEQDFFNSDYFYWIDCGCYNHIYDYMWEGWTGLISAKPNHAKFVFMTNDWKDLSQIDMEKLSYLQIATIDNVPFECGGTSWILPKNKVNDFYEAFWKTLDFFKQQRLFPTEQSVFSGMLKRGGYDLFEFTPICPMYRGLYSAIAKENNNTPYA
ncbi:WlaTC/HtrL family glycosyltransferase [Candidatus Endomicrobiellum devescovinae]|uniref:WlaTC/HtrL family glycosyltransferase n=1 Tax=Candidatus Endomicrobiellum devescovinae TaxID=3242322 RepID=UPI003593AB79